MLRLPDDARRNGRRPVLLLTDELRYADKLDAFHRARKLPDELRRNFAPASDMPDRDAGLMLAQMFLQQLNLVQDVHFAFDVV
jgi:hypothetical protein